MHTCSEAELELLLRLSFRCPFRPGDKSQRYVIGQTSLYGNSLVLTKLGVPIFVHKPVAIWEEQPVLLDHDIASLSISLSFFGSAPASAARCSSVRLTIQRSIVPTLMSRYTVTW